MNGLSFAISPFKGSMSKGRGLVGRMTVGTYTASVTLSLGTSPSNAKTKKQWPSRDGLRNSKGNVKPTVEDLVRWSTSGNESVKVKINTPRSHSGCWCNSSLKQGTDDFSSN